jgi:hypothetical protein
MDRDREYRRAMHAVRVRQALARCADGCVASHLSAASLHGFATYREIERVQLTRSQGSRRSGQTQVFVSPLPGGHVVDVDGIPTTARARTVADVARLEDFLAALVTADSALAHRIGRSRILACLETMRRWPGAEQARRVVLAADGRLESPLESVVRGRLLLLGLPMPEPQVWLADDAGTIGRVDFLWRGPRVVGEADGRLKYRANELWREKLRQERLEDAGFSVVRWTWAQAHAPDEQFRRRVLRALDRGSLRAAKRTR